MKLYGANVCPFVHRVRLVLAEKKLEHEYVAIDLGNKPDWYHEVLPTGKVPLLEHDGYRLWESGIVCEYLEEAFPTPALWPGEPGRKAEARILLDMAAGSFVPLFYKLLGAQDRGKQAEFSEALVGALSQIEEKAFQAGSGWMYGESLSLVDLQVYPWVERWCVLTHYRGLEFPTQFEQLQSWRERMAARASVAGMKEKDQYFIDCYLRYARPTDSVD